MKILAFSYFSAPNRRFFLNNNIEVNLRTTRKKEKKKKKRKRRDYARVNKRTLFFWSYFIISNSKLCKSNDCLFLL